MKKRSLYLAIVLLALFALWTVSVQLIDVQPIGPRGSVVGFAALNGFIHNLTGIHIDLYIITDWLSVVPVTFGLGFAVLGFVQCIQRRSVWKVDGSILILGGFYIVTIAIYLLFETYVVNYRPILIDGFLEASYPSSTTLLVLCVMPTAIMQLRRRIKHPVFCKSVSVAIESFIAFMVIGRLVSGVHWLTDIIGGILLSAGLVMIYDSFVG